MSRGGSILFTFQLETILYYGALLQLVDLVLVETLLYQFISITIIYMAHYYVVDDFILLRFVFVVDAENDINCLTHPIFDVEA